MTYVSVNAWTRRYREEGIEGLKTKPGRGRKAVLQMEVDKRVLGNQTGASRFRQMVMLAMSSQVSGEWGVNS